MLKMKKQSDFGPELEELKNQSFKNKKNILFVLVKLLIDKN
jgi:hypothetical protein